MFALALWCFGKKERAWHSLVYFGNSSAETTGVLFHVISVTHPPFFFFLLFFPLSSVIAVLKFIIILKLLSSHPHSASETMKKGGMCLMTHEINNPCKQLVGKMNHMSLFWMSGVFQKAGRRSVKTVLADTHVCIRTWAADLRKSLEASLRSVLQCLWGHRKSPQSEVISLLLFNYCEVFFSVEVFLKVVCSGKCCKLSNSFTTGLLPGFFANLGACQGKKKKENVVSAALDVIHFHNLSRCEGILICGCWLEWTNKF